MPVRHSAHVPPDRSDPRRSAVATALRAAGCVFAEDEAAVLLADDPDDVLLAQRVAARSAGRPLEHVVGWAELGGVRVTVRPGVFVPRRRSELLLAEATALLRPGAVVVDLCCGAGVLAAALAERGTAIELHATDLDPVAVSCARDNLAGLAEVHHGDLLAALPTRLRGRIDVLVANTPYVPTDEIALLPTEARVHEHRLALDGGADGLDVQRRLAADAPTWLAPAGSLMVETTEAQAVVTAGFFDTVGLRARVVHDDDLGATVVLGRVPAR